MGGDGDAAGTGVTVGTDSGVSVATGKGVADTVGRAVGVATGLGAGRTVGRTGGGTTATGDGVTLGTAVALGVGRGNGATLGSGVGTGVGRTGWVGRLKLSSPGIVAGGWLFCAPAPPAAPIVTASATIVRARRVAGKNKVKSASVRRSSQCHDDRAMIRQAPDATPAAIRCRDYLAGFDTIQHHTYMALFTTTFGK
ncbi:hypothetical protein AWL63_21050 [Sphingomonas panacis]|uniref:Uncharacterized protein n=1 Tax=Sphingomonas panacis TaxID=1560345 RepID=A0A1B3ZF69_9SPHN|nr:hypothetical protein AWL63_21050 [Sphingomonas panacis]